METSIFHKQVQGSGTPLHQSTAWTVPSLWLAGLSSPPTPPLDSSSLREVQSALGPSDTSSLGSGIPALTVTAVGSCPPAFLKGCPLGRASPISVPLLLLSGAWPILVRSSLPLPCPALGLPDQAAARLGLGGLPGPSVVGSHQLSLGPSIRPPSPVPKRLCQRRAQTPCEPRVTDPSVCPWSLSEWL